MSELAELELSPLQRLELEEGWPSFGAICRAIDYADRSGKTVRYSRWDINVVVYPGDNPHRMYEIYFRHMLSSHSKYRFTSEEEGDMETARRAAA